MNSVWEDFLQEQTKRERREEQARFEAVEAERLLAEDLAAERDAKAREDLFHRTYPDPQDQDRVLASYQVTIPVLGAEHPARRPLAIAAWW